MVKIEKHEHVSIGYMSEKFDKEAIEDLRGITHLYAGINIIGDHTLNLTGVFDSLVEVQGNIIINGAIVANFPKLVTIIGAIDLTLDRADESVIAEIGFPELEIVTESIRINKMEDNDKINFDKLLTVDIIEFDSPVKPNNIFDSVSHIGSSLGIRSNDADAIWSFPNLQTVGKNTPTTVSYAGIFGFNVTAHFPILTHSICLAPRADAVFHVPVLMKAHYFLPNARSGERGKIVHPAFDEHEVKHFDGSDFIVKSTKQVDGVTIYSGYTCTDIVDGKLHPRVNEGLVYVASDGVNHAHAMDVRSAVLELEFKQKVASGSKATFKLDDYMTIEKYRLLTGACSLGVKEFMDDNNIPYTLVGNKDNFRITEKEPMLVRDLLEIFKNKSYYGSSMLERAIIED